MIKKMDNKKQLLVDVITLQILPQVLKQAIENPNAPLKIRGVIQRANAKNHNGRIYPLNILKRQVEKYQQAIREYRATGQLDHPQSQIVSLKNVSHRITEAHWQGEQLVGTLQILPTPNGNIAKNLILAGIKLGISSRGLGSVRRVDDYDMVQDDFQLISFDLVAEPSTKGAYLHAVNQSIQQKQDKYSKINGLISQILGGL